MKTDFASVTETWGLPASPEQLAMAYCRYKMAGDLAAGKAVLEIGCGSGMGLAYLRQRAARAVGGDPTESLLDEARRHLPGAELVHLDAERLPFADASFDVVLMLEMLYYVHDVDQALREVRRIVRPGGEVMICVPNRERPDFNPSPFSVHYHSAGELRDLLGRHGFRVRLYGGFPVEADSGRDQLLARLRQFAVRFRLIPRSMRAKAVVKRLLYGRLARLGPVVEGMATYPEPVLLDAKPGPVTGFKNLYAIGQRD